MNNVIFGTPLPPNDDMILEKAIEVANQISKGHKKCSELLAQLIHKDLGVIFHLERVGLSSEEIWNLYYTTNKRNLDGFIKHIKNIPKQKQKY